MALPLVHHHHLVHPALPARHVEPQRAVAKLAPVHRLARGAGHHHRRITGSRQGAIGSSCTEFLPAKGHQHLPAGRVGRQLDGPPRRVDDAPAQPLDGEVYPGEGALPAGVVRPHRELPRAHLQRRHQHGVAALRQVKVLGRARLHHLPPRGRGRAGGILEEQLQARGHLPQGERVAGRAAGLRAAAAADVGPRWRTNAHAATKGRQVPARAAHHRLHPARAAGGGASRFDPISTCALPAHVGQVAAAGPAHRAARWLIIDGEGGAGIAHGAGAGDGNLRFIKIFELVRICFAFIPNRDYAGYITPSTTIGYYCYR